MAQYKTWQEAPKSWTYKWVKYTDWSTTPLPTKEEKEIKLTKKENFPPIRSANKWAFWSD